MEILHISDTHGFHELLTPEIEKKKFDLIIHSGDASNEFNSNDNFLEMRRFIDWYAALDIKHKIYVAGNHDTSIERKKITRTDFETEGITYLEVDGVTIEKLKIFGIPYTPTYGNWAFMRKRGQLGEFYKEIPEDTNLLITHGPPKGILDLSTSREGKLELCGCKELLNYIEHSKVEVHLFGHIHDNNDIINHGLREINGVHFSNASVVKDGKFGKLYSYGNTFYTP